MNNIIVVRSGGDIATGIVQKLYRSGFKVIIAEVPQPTAIRRTVSLCEAVYDGSSKVEDVYCKRINNINEAEKYWNENIVTLIVDPACSFIDELKPVAVVDAIIAKKNLGTTIDMAPITVGIGPGFTAKKDVDVVIESMRGHDLGRLIFDGSAMPNTGSPGEIAGESIRRVVHAPVQGEVSHTKPIGSVVEEGEEICKVGGISVLAPFTGLLRGMIREGLFVPKGMKIADIDPRIDVDFNTISDKARCIGGAVLEACMYFLNYKLKGLNL